ncbi:hypothetical protein D3C79_923680 [compost metagenome]
MLGGATIVGAQLAVAQALGEALWVDQEAVCFGAQAGGPGFEQLAFAAQFFELAVTQAGGMTDPQVDVAMLSLGQRAKAAHQEQAVDRAVGVAQACLVRERSRQPLAFGDQVGIGLEARYAGRGAT